MKGELKKKVLKKIRLMEYDLAILRSKADTFVNELEDMQTVLGTIESILDNSIIEETTPMDLEKKED